MCSFGTLRRGDYAAGYAAAAPQRRWLSALLVRGWLAVARARIKSEFGIRSILLSPCACRGTLAESRPWGSVPMASNWFPPRPMDRLPCGGLSCLAPNLPGYPAEGVA